jgi:hypothetical protein
VYIHLNGCYYTFYWLKPIPQKLSNYFIHASAEYTKLLQLYCKAAMAHLQQSSGVTRNGNIEQYGRVLDDVVHKVNKQAQISAPNN